MFFRESSSGLKKGFNTVAGHFQSLVNLTPLGGIYHNIQNLPRARKTKLTPSIVSNTPRGDLFGYRSTTKDAVTLGGSFNNWWRKSVDYSQSIWDNYKKSYQGYKTKEAVVNTLGNIINTSVTQGVTTLTDYFARKWGLKAEPGSFNDRTGNTPYRPNTDVYHYVETQSNAPATEPFSGNLFDLLTGSQPKGEYSIAYPQSEAIPTVMPVPTFLNSGVGSGNMTLYMIVAALVFVGYIMLKNTKA